MMELTFNKIASWRTATLLKVGFPTIVNSTNGGKLCSLQKVHVFCILCIIPAGKHLFKDNNKDNRARSIRPSTAILPKKGSMDFVLVCLWATCQIVTQNVKMAFSFETTHPHLKANIFSVVKHLTWVPLKPDQLQRAYLLCHSNFIRPK